MRRAEAMGQKAYQLASELLAASDTHLGGVDPDLGKLAERQELLQRRKEVMSQRMALLEEREALYASRTEALERAESAVGDLEQKLVRRESAISDTARQVFSAASNLLDDDDEDDEPAPLDYAASVASVIGSSATISGGAMHVGANRVRQHTPAIDVSEQSRAMMQGSAQSGRTASQPRVVAGPAIAGETLKVASGEVEQDEPDESMGGVSRAEDKATRKRASARARVRTNQFKITLEAHLDDGEPHHFFRYENDGPEDLPGLFIATPNLLKVGREVRIRVGRSNQFLEATGIVAWRRQRGDAAGTPGMGIELLNLSEPEKNLVGKWIADKTPVTI